MDILTWFHDRSNITFAIAIIGFVISLYNFFRAMWDRRCAVTVEYISHNCTLGHMGHTQFIIRMNIQNQTSASLCISRMFLVYENQTYEFAFPAQQVWEFTSTHGKTVTNKKEAIFNPWAWCTRSLFHSLSPGNPQKRIEEILRVRNCYPD